jgi:pilus assembly protein Flp/PilA
MTQRLRRRLGAVGDAGASAVEYGLLVAAVAVVIVGIVFGFGHLLQITMSNTTTCISSQGKSPGNAACPNN